MKKLRQKQECWIIFIGIVAMVTASTYPFYHNSLEKNRMEDGLRIVELEEYDIKRNREVGYILTEKDKEIAGLREALIVVKIWSKR